MPVVCNRSGVLWFCCLDYKGHVRSASVAWHWVLGQCWHWAILFYRRGFLPKSLGQWYTHSSAQPHLTEHHKQRAMKMDPYATANSILRIANVPGVTSLAANSSGFTCHMLNYNRAWYWMGLPLLCVRLFPKVVLKKIHRKQFSAAFTFTTVEWEGN